MEIIIQPLIRIGLEYCLKVNRAKTEVMIVDNRRHDKQIAGYEVLAILCFRAPLAQFRKDARMKLGDG